MARPRTFEPDKALDLAMQVFWRKGYSETSYDDLVSETGVSRKSLYSVFGDKEELFLKALRHYCKTRIPVMFETLSKENLSLEDIHDLFLWLSGLTASGKLAQGCFMANTATDEMIRNPKVKAAYDRYIKTMIEMLDDGFRRAGLSKDKARELAVYYLGILQSLQLMAHAGTSEEIVETFAGTALKEIKVHMR